MFVFQDWWLDDQVIRSMTPRSTVEHVRWVCLPFSGCLAQMQSRMQHFVPKDCIQATFKSLTSPGLFYDFWYKVDFHWMLAICGDMVPNVEQSPAFPSPWVGTCWAHDSFGNDAPSRPQCRLFFREHSAGHFHELHGCG